ncbi:E-selectin-like [Pangasianodon hypophthalmus]|uniref:E-selectin-like n=1 Tax=Pangasianodon hypophthalmus TaxID=310915 RepID=UPI002308108C|nr:E-selectin-like [Pangasianodon hypophthalmus]
MLSLFFSVLVLLFGVAAGMTREYISVTMTKNWTDAQKHCRENYRDLATITNNEENQRLNAIKGGSDSVWIGMYRDEINVDFWLWSDGTSSSFFQWNTNQPNNNGGNQNCVEIEPGGWNDQRCYEDRRFVCYQFLVLVKENKTWEEALEYCRMNYTGLASPASVTQLQLAEMESSQTQTDRVWAGLRFQNGKWLWVSKEPLGTLVSLPSCPAPRYRCGARNTKTHLWENRDCNEKLNFLCY